MDELAAAAAAIRPGSDADALPEDPVDRDRGDLPSDNEGVGLPGGRRGWTAGCV